MYLGSATFIKFRKPISSTTLIGLRSRTIHSHIADVRLLNLSYFDEDLTTYVELVRY